MHAVTAVKGGIIIGLNLLLVLVGVMIFQINTSVREGVVEVEVVKEVETEEIGAQ